MSLITKEITSKISPYFLFFYYVGQSPSLFLKSPLRLFQRFPTLPSIIFLCLHSGLFFTGVIYQFILQTYQANNLIICLYFVTELIVSSVIFVQSKIYRITLEQIHDEIKSVATLFPSECDFIGRFRQSLKYFRNKMIAVSTIFIVDNTLNLIPYLDIEKHLFADLHLTILQTATVIACMHGMLYIDLLNFNLTMLNSLIDRQMTDTGFDVKIDLLKKSHWIHFKLWNIAKNISQSFGWGIGAILIRNFLDISFIIYWTFVEISRHENYTVKFIRNNNLRIFYAFIMTTGNICFTFLLIQVHLLDS